MARQVISIKSPMNPQFDDVQEDIRLADHIGLASLAADLIIKRNSNFAKYREDVIADLTSKLWEIIEFGNFDPSKGLRFSTYAMRGLINHHRDLNKRFLRKDEYVKDAPVEFSWSAQSDASCPAVNELEESERTDLVRRLLAVMPESYYEYYRARVASGNRVFRGALLGMRGESDCPKSRNRENTRCRDVMKEVRSKMPEWYEKFLEEMEMSDAIR